MPQSRTRYQRAAMRSKYRKPKRRRSGSFGWNVAIATVIIVGVVAVVLTRGGGDSAGSGPPHAADQATNQPGDHWHTALGVNICGEWLDPAPAFEKPSAARTRCANAGIHSHGDGLIHTHPLRASEEGNNATLGKFVDYGGWSVSSDSIDLAGRTTPTPSGRARRRSEEDLVEQRRHVPVRQVQGQEVQLTWAVDGKTKTGNPADYHQQDGETIAIGFLPKGAEHAVPGPGVHGVRQHLRPEHRRGGEQELAVPVGDHHDAHRRRPPPRRRRRRDRPTLRSPRAP